jgi:hypothetical protein
MKNSLSLLLALSLPGIAFAQANFDRDIANVTLLQYKEVKDDLKIKQKQRDAMNKAASKYNVLAQKIEQKLQDRKEPTESEKKALDAEFVVMRKGVLTSLTPAQLKRLREVTLQDAGLFALTDKIVAKKVGMTEAQRNQVINALKGANEKANKAENAVIEKVRNEFKNRKPKNKAEEDKIKGEIQKRMEAEMKKLEPKIIQIHTDGRNNVFKALSTKQRDAWNALLGKPLAR